MFHNKRKKRFIIFLVVSFLIIFITVFLALYILKEFKGQESDESYTAEAVKLNEVITPIVPVDLTATSDAGKSTEIVKQTVSAEFIEEDTFIKEIYLINQGKYQDILVRTGCM